MAGSNLTGKGFWHLVEHILPFYVILLIAYGFARKGLINSDSHGPGLARWTSLIGIPVYVFNLLAFNDPYKIDLKLVGADALQKVIVLIIAGLWWRFSKHGNIDGVITFFMLATLSNLVLVGPALFQPLYGVAGEENIATLLILQCAIWYNLCIMLFEIRVVLKQITSDHDERRKEFAQFGELQRQAENIPLENMTSMLEGIDPEYGGKNSPVRLQRTTSAPARVSFSPRVAPFPAMLEKAVQVDEREGDEAQVTSETNKRANDSTSVAQGVHPEEPTKAVVNPDHDIEGESVTIEVPERVHFDGPRMSTSSSVRIANAGIATVAVKVFHRMKQAPLTYTSVAGFVYSLMAFKWNWDMPYPIKTSVRLVANGAIAISVVVMALTWKDSGRLISCGVKKMTYGFIFRFLVSPIIMVGCAFAFGLQDVVFEFSILQAALPVGLISFVLAKEYDLDVQMFSTAVITQLVVFLPLVVIYIYLLKPVGKQTNI